MDSSHCIALALLTPKPMALALAGTTTQAFQPAQQPGKAFMHRGSFLTVTPTFSPSINPNQFNPTQHPAITLATANTSAPCQVLLLAIALARIPHFVACA